MSVRKFLVVVDDSSERDAALRYACRRAASTGGRVSLLRTTEKAVFEHWSGVRDEIERQTRAEAEAALQTLADQVVALSGQAPELLIREGDAWSCIRAVTAEEPEIKVLVLAAAVGRSGPGPLVASLAKAGMSWGKRRLAVTIVPGDLSDEEIADLA